MLWTNTRNQYNILLLIKNWNAYEASNLDIFTLLPQRGVCVCMAMYFLSHICICVYYIVLSEEIAILFKWVNSDIISWSVFLTSSTLWRARCIHLCLSLVSNQMPYIWLPCARQRSLQISHWASRLLCCQIVLGAVTIPLSKHLFGGNWKSEMMSIDIQVCSQYSLERVPVDKDLNWQNLSLWF